MTNKLQVMNKQDQINKLVDDTLNSFDNAVQATPKPYLLTRINARISSFRENAWERTAKFISRPSVAIAFCAVVLINVMVVVFDRPAAITVAEQGAQAGTDEFSYTANIYDFENTTP